MQKDFYLNDRFSMKTGTRRGSVLPTITQNKSLDLSKSHNFGNFDPNQSLNQSMSNFLTPGNQSKKF
jgi:hypothetical protein